MRPDMHEVVIERPRWGSSQKRKKDRWSWTTDEEGERSPRRGSTSRRRGGTRELSDLLGPLRRFLDRSVGRPWDAVYSELRAGLSPKSQIHMHILEHVDQMVGRRGWSTGPFFICPKTGLLRREKSWRILRDPERGDDVGLRRFLERRVGRRWEEVRRQLQAAERSPWALVAERVVRQDGRILPVIPATSWREEHLGLPLGRGRLYVEDGRLARVR